MAFEAYRTQDQRPTKLRRVVILVAAVFHGALIAAGIVYSYWHVDELTPPTLRVTFIAAAPPPPPPPPPPPAGGSGVKKKVAMKPKTPTPVVVQKPTEIVQPREKPAPVKKEFRKHEDQYDDDEDEADTPKGPKGGVKGGTIGGEEGGTIGGTVGGTKGGTIGGTIGGSMAAPVAPKMLAPNLGLSQRQGCPKPTFPPQLRRAGESYLLGAKICVSRTGTVEAVTILRHGDSLLEQSIIASEKACHYNPWVVGGTTAPFCYVQTFEFKGE